MAIKQEAATKQYELTVLLHPDLEIDLDKPIKTVEKIITENGGKITQKDIWGKQKLAYQIQHQDYAIYVYFELELPAQASQKIQSVLNITGEVMRYLLVAKDLKVPEPEEEVESSADTDKEE